MKFKEIKSKGEELTFSEVKKLISLTPQKSGRTGIFNVRIKNNGKKYFFEQLKENYSIDSTFGFGLNHYGWLGLVRQNYKNSKFHDEEDVSIDVDYDDFLTAYTFENYLAIKTKTFKMVVNW